ncbi:hypothetical protein AAFF_G00001630 [Aldrovandia affinis]|uniref:Uncharacterized protein n=1 Tax=Aldrovandia affinis TaxID=143900 RepID=A0AAD7X4L8_9TELE|nr:hypothetical protein AAFF_G00001630 [Aldrovandia affinis]
MARVVPGCKSVAVTARGCGGEIFIAGHTLADDTLVSVLAGRLGRTQGSSSWQEGLTGDGTRHSEHSPLHSPQSQPPRASRLSYLSVRSRPAVAMLSKRGAGEQ